MKPANFPRNRQRKQKEAKERQVEWDSLSLEKKLKELDKRPGESKKEKAKLKVRLEADKSTKKSKDTHGTKNV